MDANPGNEADRVRARIANGPLLEPVLGRLLAILAARADLGVDRVTEAMAIADALAAHAPSVTANGHLEVEFEPRPGVLTIELVGLEVGGGRRLIEMTAIEDLGTVIERLSDSTDVEAADDSERLKIRIGTEKA